jgi:hypothetical protein
MLVYLDRGELPEAIVFVLRPKGKYRVPERRELRSRHGLSSCRVNGRVVELWQIPGADLLQAGDVGLIPWVPLTDLSYLRSDNVALLTILRGRRIILESPLIDAMALEK